MNSEIARIKGQIEQEFAAASTGMNGFATVGRHDIIARRYARIDALYNELKIHIDPVAAARILGEASEAGVKER